MEGFQQIHGQAVDLLRDLCTSNGILASLIEADNYRRIWARDSIVSGLAGILIKDNQIVQGLKNSLLTLSKGQHELGMIPSNVDPEDTTKVSYGSLAGRIDTNTWFIIGVALYVKYSNDVEFFSEMEPAVDKCREYLRSIEFNGKGWIYTPLSGNWADEYPVNGFTLYDNCLRIWAETLWQDITDEESHLPREIIEKTKINFWPVDNANPELIYHNSAYKVALDQKKKYFFSQILPGHYNGRFDAAGNALAQLLFGLDKEQKIATVEWMEDLESEIGQPLLPAFWPVIDKHDEDWRLLENNYSYEFKNDPYKFHNGGIWPVWMGLYCMGLSISGLEQQAEKLIRAFVNAVKVSNSWDFHEYINSNSFEFQGKIKMGYTASGVVFMNAALNDPHVLSEFWQVS